MVRVVMQSQSGSERHQENVSADLFSAWKPLPDGRGSVRSSERWPPQQSRDRQGAVSAAWAAPQRRHPAAHRLEAETKILEVWPRAFTFTGPFPFVRRVVTGMLRLNFGSSTLYWFVAMNLIRDRKARSASD